MDRFPRVPISDSLDLHSFLPRDVVSVVDEYLRAAAKKGFREVRLIPGKGKGIRRAEVIRLLAQHPLVKGFSDAPPDRGGMGAIVVDL
jgi:DNA-nicking Smr family endonuclease